MQNFDQPPRELGGSRKFTISPKMGPPDIHTKWKENTSYMPVAQAMSANARELTPNVDWHEIMNDIVSTRKLSGQKVYGDQAVGMTVVPAVGSIAANMDWALHQPELVYLSGNHFAYILGEKIEGLLKYRGQLDAVRNVETIAKVDTDVARLRTFKGRMNESLTEYSTENSLSVDHQELLKRMMYQIQGYKREKIYPLLKTGKLEEAYKLAGIR